MSAGEPRRGGCLTAFLILMMVGNGLTALVYLFAAAALRRSWVHFPTWASWALVLSSVVNCLIAVALWNWKTWAMYVYCGSVLLTFLVNWRSLGILPALLGLAGGLIGIAIVGVLVVAALSYPREWHLADGTAHTVRVEHEAVLTGKVVLSVDGQEVFRRPRKIWDNGLAHRFEVAGKECQLRIVLKVWYYDYELWVDGQRLRAVPAVSGTRP